MTIIGYGYKEAGLTQLADMAEEIDAEEREKAREKSQRESAIARVQSMFNMKQGQFGPAQWAYVNALQRQEQGVSIARRGNPGHPALGPATGRFRIAR